MVERSITVSYQYLLAIADRALVRAKETEADPFLDYLQVVLYSALALEAFLNHIGSRIFPLWAPLKKKLSAKEKLQVIAASRKIEIKFGEAPYQSFISAFAFRNLIVHAETEVAERGSRSSATHLPEAEWQMYCKSSVAERILQDTKTIISTLPGQVSVNEIPLFLLAYATT
jgi:hypothetical protein